MNSILLDYTLTERTKYMRQITEQQILALAPNATAASNGRKISQNGGFIRLEQAPDDTFYLGECTGSGKNNYITTADFQDENASVFRCTCPSRQFPCKHSLGLLYEIMAQLAFWVTFDEARKEYIDTGCWADLDTGEVSMTYNYRPMKALKYVKQEDTVFGVAQVPLAVYYPGEGNKRVRWEAAAVRPLEKGDLESLKARACVSLTIEAKAAKNTLKNAMADPGEAASALWRIPISSIRNCSGVTLDMPSGTGRRWASLL